MGHPRTRRKCDRRQSTDYCLLGNATTKHERQQVSERYSCVRIMQEELKQGRLPSVQIASSIIAGFQTQEAAKVILGLPWAAGHMIQYEASGMKTYLDVRTHFNACGLLV